MSVQNKPKKLSKSQRQLLGDGNKKLEQKEPLPIEDTTSLLLQKMRNHETALKESILQLKSATAESLPTTKRKILSDKKNYLEEIFQPIQLSETLGQVLTSNEKALKPFWNSQSKKLSEKLWLPTKTDCAVSDLSSLNSTSKNFLTQTSWFSTKQHTPLISSKTFYQSQPSSLLNSMDSGQESQRKILKVLKIRLVLTQQEKKDLKEYFGVFRWYYNCTKDICDMQDNLKEVKDKYDKLKYDKVRSLVRTYKYDNKKYVKTDQEEFPKPDWMKEDIHNRIPRGAIRNYVTNYKSAESNFKAGNIKKFELKHRTKKDKSQMLQFEDNCIPAFIRQYKGIYKIGRRRITFEQVQQCTHIKGITINYDEKLNRYTLIYPVDDYTVLDFSDNQTKGKQPFISLDTGVRAFQTGYGGDHVVEIGSGDTKRLGSLLKEADKLKCIMDLYGWTKKRSRKFAKINYKIKCLVTEIHWKTASFLTKTYKTILLPEFAISGMVKGRKLPKIVKRLMYAYSYYKFKEKLAFKAKEHNAVLHIVDEDYTSQTCGKCGELTKTRSKTFECATCKTIIDRDFNGARNILLKNYKKVFVSKP